MSSQIQYKASLSVQQVSLLKSLVKTTAYPKAAADFKIPVIFIKSQREIVEFTLVVYTVAFYTILNKS